MTGEKQLKRRTLKIIAVEGADEEAVKANAIAGPELASAAVMTDFAVGLMGDTSLTEAVDVLKANGRAVIRNDMSKAEAMLASQASALNTMFADLALRSSRSMAAGRLEATEAFMRMAFKAQNQCRMTLETLATIKSPPAVFATQTNITSGPQQINNGLPDLAVARENLSAPNKLMEHKHVEWMDAGAAGEASGGDSAVAALVSVNRT